MHVRSFSVFVVLLCVLCFLCSYRFLCTDFLSSCLMFISPTWASLPDIKRWTTPSPGWGPRGQGPSKNRQGPGKNNWTVHVKNRKRPNGNHVLFHGGWSRRLSHTHSYPGCHAPDRLVVALADQGCSQYTSIAAYDYS